MSMTQAGIKKTIMGLLVCFGLTTASLLFVQPTPTLAASSIVGCDDANCLDSATERRGTTNVRDSLGIPTVSINLVARRALGILLTAAGALSVIYLVVGGIKYSSSNGDTTRVQSAKNTITYAIIGLIISITAGAIVGFVLSSSPAPS